MFKDLFDNRLFIGAFVFFVLMVVSGTFYMWHVERQEAANLAETQARIKALTEKQKPTTAEVPVGDTSQGGHVHADGTFHAQPHDAPIEDSEAEVGGLKALIGEPPPRDYSKGAGNPPPFENVPVDLYDFEATKAAMIENINFVKANWNPKTFFDKDLGREMRIAKAISENIANATMLGIYTREQARELRELHSGLLDFTDSDGKRVQQLKDEGYTRSEAIRIAAEEMVERWGVK